jgi:hypothetical protein
LFGIFCIQPFSFSSCLLLFLIRQKRGARARSDLGSDEEHEDAEAKAERLGARLGIFGGQTDSSDKRGLSSRASEPDGCSRTMGGTKPRLDGDPAGAAVGGGRPEGLAQEVAASTSSRARLVGEGVAVPADTRQAKTKRGARGGRKEGAPIPVSVGPRAGGALPEEQPADDKGAAFVPSSTFAGAGWKALAIGAACWGHTVLLLGPLSDVGRPTLSYDCWHGCSQLRVREGSLLVRVVLPMDCTYFSASARWLSLQAPGTGSSSRMVQRA